MRPSLPLVLALACAAALVLVGPGSARPAATDACLEPGDTPVHMRTRDGVALYGLEVGTGTTGVVLGHQYFSDHCEFMAFARELAGLGYRAISIDFRGNGVSASGRSNRLDLDVAAAVAHLRAEGATRVKLVGASMGGTAALVAGSWLRPAVDGIVSLSGPDYFRGLNAVRAVQRSRVPVRFLVSRDDRPFASDATTLMRRAATGDKAIARYTAAGHGSSILSVPAAHALVLAFLAR